MGCSAAEVRAAPYCAAGMPLVVAYMGSSNTVPAFAWAVAKMAKAFPPEKVVAT